MPATTPQGALWELNLAWQANDLQLELRIGGTYNSVKNGESTPGIMLPSENLATAEHLAYKDWPGFSCGRIS